MEMEIAIKIDSEGNGKLYQKWVEQEVCCHGNES